MRITDTIRAQAEADPAAPALFDGERRWTRGELQQAAVAFGERCRGMGVGPGMRIGLQGGHGGDYVVRALGLLDLGAVIVPVQASATAERRALVTERLGVAAWVGLDGTLETTGAPAPREDLSDLAFIRFTSGTTDEARGVALTHHSIAARHRAANDALALDPTDGVLFPLDMAHHFVVSVLLILRCGARLLLPSQALPGPMAEVFAAGQGTVVYGAPHHLRLLAGGVPAGGLAGLRLALSTTAPLASAVPGDFLARHAVPLGQAYGIIEVGLPCLDLDGAAGTVGHPVPAFEVQLRNPVDGVGRVAVRGPGLFDAYVSPWRPRTEVCPDGWFLSGDLGRFDHQGRLVLMGREQAVINFGGVKIFPVELEDVLNRHPQVIESLVRGLPHPKLGELPIAQVVAAPEARPTTRELLQFLRQHVPPRELPTEIRWVEALPRTATGKLLRRPLG